MKLKVPISYFLTNKKKLILDPDGEEAPASFTPSAYIVTWDDPESDRAIIIGSDKRWEGTSDLGNKVVVKWHAERWELYSVKGKDITFIGYRKSVRPLGQYHSDSHEKVVVR